MASGKKASVREVEIRIEYMALSELLGRRWDDNPKMHDFTSLGASMMRFGFNDPIAVNETTGRICEGHGRVEQLADMRNAAKNPPARVKLGEDGEWLVPVVRGISFASDEEANAYAVAHNRTVERGGWDEEKLLITLRPLSEMENGLEGLGYTADDVAAMSSFGQDGLPPADLEKVDFTGDVPTLNETIVIKFNAKDEAVEFRKRLNMKSSGKTCNGTVLLQVLRGEVTAEGGDAFNS